MNKISFCQIESRPCFQAKHFFFFFNNPDTEKKKKTCFCFGLVTLIDIDIYIYRIAGSEGLVYIYRL